MNKLSMPDDQLVEKTMTPDQRREHREMLAKWRQQQENGEHGQG